VYLERLIVLAYGKCICPCAHHDVVEEGEKVKFTLERAMKAQRSGGIAVLFL
jgi:hypothetical protein